MHQQHAPIRVVLVADYQALARLYGEALRLLQVAQVPGADGGDGSRSAIECVQSQVASPLSQVA